MTQLTDLATNVLSYGFSSSRYLLNVYSWINDAQIDVVRQMELKTQQTSSSVVTISNDSTYAMPSNFFKIIDLYQPSDQDSLEEIEIRDYDESDITALGEPMKYLVIGDQLTLWPTPDGVYTFTLRYWKLPATLLVSTDVPEISSEYDNLLISYVLAKAYARENDMQQSDFHRQRYFEDLARAKGSVAHSTSYTPKQVAGTWSGTSGQYS